MIMINKADSIPFKYCLLLLLFILLCLTPQIQGQHLFRVKEETLPGTVVADLSGLLGQCESVSIVNSQSVGVSAFYVDAKSRNLTISGRLDREDICSQQHLSRSSSSSSSISSERSMLECTLELKLIFTNGGEQNFVNIQILIMDINDNRPNFPVNQPYTIKFKDGDEVGRRRLLPQARDPDVGVNGKISYRLIVEHAEAAGIVTFHLQQDESGLYLVTMRALDREQTSEYYLQLIAEDHGEPQVLNSSLRLFVSVDDVNDNAPVFTQSLFQTSTPLIETAGPGTLVLTLKATDRDAGDNGQFHFDFSPPYSPHEVVDDISLDGKDISSASLARYYLSVHGNGQIVVRRRLDYDTLALRGRPELKFKVLVVDHAPAPYALSSEANVLVQLMDANDEPPQVLIHSLDKNPNTGQNVIRENSPIKTAVALIQTSDRDYGGRDTVQCQLETNTARPPDMLQLTSTGPNEYRLYTEQIVDAEATSAISVTIQCYDEAKHVVRRDITFQVSDLNDNPPTFKRSEMDFYVDENRPPGTPIETDSLIHAVDLDSGQNGQVTYRLDPLSANNFTIHAVNGMLTTRVTFDHEERQEYSLMVFAMDNGSPSLTASARIRIRIRDLNDCSPIFQKDIYTFDIQESIGGNNNNNVADNSGMPLETDIEIGSVQAVDRDTDYGIVRYSIQHAQIDSRAQNNQQYFTVNPRNGVLLTTRPLDRETIAMHNLIIWAYDNGRPERLSSSTTVMIRILDRNDCAPQFTFPSTRNRTIEVDTTWSVGHTITFVTATDADEGINAELEYKLDKFYEKGYFTLDKHTGMIFLAQSFHSQTRLPLMKKLVMFACDKGEPQLCSPPTELLFSYRSNSGGGGGSGGGAGGLKESDQTLSSSKMPKAELQTSNLFDEPIVFLLCGIFGLLTLAAVFLVCMLARKSSVFNKKSSPPDGALNKANVMSGHYEAAVESNTLLAQDERRRHNGTNADSINIATLTKQGGYLPADESASIDMSAAYFTLRPAGVNRMPPGDYCSAISGKCSTPVDNKYSGVIQHDQGMGNNGMYYELTGTKTKNFPFLTTDNNGRLTYCPHPQQSAGLQQPPHYQQYSRHNDNNTIVSAGGGGGGVVGVGVGGGGGGSRNDKVDAMLPMPVVSQGRQTKCTKDVLPEASFV